jgi:hypothetical protein
MSWKTIWVIAADEGLLQTGPKATSGDYVIAEDGRASALRNGSASQAAFNVALDNNMAGRMPSLVSTSTNRYSFGDSSCCHLAKDAERQVRPFCLA